MQGTPNGAEQIQVMPCCADCKHWYRPSTEKLYANFKTDMGRCTNSSILFGRDRERIMIDTTDIVLPELYTGCGFGCVHFEAK